jgi:hypothetical protein
MAEDQALARLREILARPEYHVDASVPWWQQLLQPLFDLLGYGVARLVQTLSDSATGREGWLGLLALVVSAGVFAFAAAYMLRAIRLSVVRETRLESVNLRQRRERSDRLWQSAQQLAAAGQLAEAVRVLYLSALYALDESAVLHVETALTNREHVRLLGLLRPSLASTFNEIVDQYDRIRYGHAAVAPETFEDFRGRIARLRSASS